MTEDQARWNAHYLLKRLGQEASYCESLARDAERAPPLSKVRAYDGSFAQCAADLRRVAVALAERINKL